MQIDLCFNMASFHVSSAMSQITRGLVTLQVVV